MNGSASRAGLRVLRSPSAAVARWALWGWRREVGCYEDSAEAGHGAALVPDDGGLVAWAERIGRHPGKPGCRRLRFAFYGRVSTEDWQDPVTSRARQREQAAALVAGHGEVVAEFFDAEVSAGRGNTYIRED